MERLLLLPEQKFAIVWLSSGARVTIFEWFNIDVKSITWIASFLLLLFFAFSIFQVGLLLLCCDGHLPGRPLVQWASLKVIATSQTWKHNPVILHEDNNVKI